MERKSWHVSRLPAALAQARASRGIALDEYVERSVSDGTITREGYERALTEERADAGTEGA